MSPLNANWWFTRITHPTSSSTLTHNLRSPKVLANIVSFMIQTCRCHMILLGAKVAYPSWNCQKSTLSGYIVVLKHYFSVRWCIILLWAQPTRTKLAHQHGETRY